MCEGAMAQNEQHVIKGDRVPLGITATPAIQYLCAISGSIIQPIGEGDKRGFFPLCSH